MLTTQGECVTQLALIGEGQALVVGNQAAATVRVSATRRAFVFDLEKLRQLMSVDESVAIALHQVLGRDVVQKLKLRNAE